MVCGTVDLVWFGQPLVQRTRLVGSGHAPRPYAVVGGFKRGANCIISGLFAGKIPLVAAHVALQVIGLLGHRAAGGDICLVHRRHRGIFRSPGVASLHRSVKDRGGEFTGGRIAGIDRIAG